jgi:hypothetical protein
MFSTPKTEDSTGPGGLFLQPAGSNKDLHQYLTKGIPYREREAQEKFTYETGVAWGSGKLMIVGRARCTNELALWFCSVFSNISKKMLLSALFLLHGSKNLCAGVVIGGTFGALQGLSKSLSEGKLPLPKGKGFVGS